MYVNRGADPGRARGEPGAARNRQVSSVAWRGFVFECASTCGVMSLAAECVLLLGGETSKDALQRHTSGMVGESYRCRQMSLPLCPVLYVCIYKKTLQDGRATRMYMLRWTQCRLKTTLLCAGAHPLHAFRAVRVLFFVKKKIFFSQKPAKTRKNAFFRVPKILGICHRKTR